MKFLNHTVMLCLAYEEAPHYFPQQWHHFTSVARMHQAPNVSTSSVTLPIFIKKKIVILMDAKYYLLVVLIYISLMTGNIKHLFMCLFAICIVFFGEMVKSFAHF